MTRPVARVENLRVHQNFGWQNVSHWNRIPSIQ